MHQHLLPGETGNGGPPTVVALPVQENDIDLREVVRTLRRRWLLVLFSMVAVFAAGWVWQSRQPLLYTAEALTDKEIKASPLELTPLTMMGRVSPQQQATQTALIRSRAVLVSVIDSLGLRLKLRDEGLARSAVFSSVRVGEDAVLGQYTLTVDGDSVHLSRDGGGVKLAGLVGQPLTGTGLQVVVAPEARQHQPVRFRIEPLDASVRALRTQLGVQPIAETTMLRLRFTSPDPELAASIVSSAAEAYQRMLAHRAREQATRQRMFIAGELARMGDSLRYAQEQLLRYQEQSGTLDPTIEGESLLTMLITAENDLRTLRYDEVMLDTLVRGLQRDVNSEEALRRTVVLGRGLVPGVETIYLRLQDAMSTRNSLTASRAGFTANAPQVEVVDAQIAAFKSEMKELTEQALRQARDARMSAERRVDELEARLVSVPGRSTSMARLQQDVGALRAAHELLTGKYYEAQIAEAVETGDVHVVDAASPPALPNPRHQIRNMVLALILGLWGGIAVALLVDYFDRTIRLPADLERAAGLQTLTVIPKLPPQHVTPTGVEAPGTAKARRGALEAFSNLRTMLRFARSERMRLMAVTSPGPGEGKSVVAANLATSLARDNNRVLLVDADLRRPNLHRSFEVPLTPGLTNVLIGESALEATVIRVADNVDLLVRGDGTPKPAELLGSQAFTAFVQDAMQRYDTILFDTAPVLVVTDTSVIAPMLDGIVMVARSGKTNRAAFSAAVSQLRRVGGNVVGAVLNCVQRSGGAYGSYEYGYYYQYEYGEETPETPSSSAASRIRALVGSGDGD